MEDTHDLDNMNVQDCNDSECPASKNPKPKIAALLDYVEVFVVAIALVILLFSFALRVCSVSGRSMENTLYEGETLIISDLFYEPGRGDIIVFHQTGEGYNEPIVKRVIALEGETIDIDFKTFTVTVTDKYGSERTVLDEDYMYLDTGYARLFSDHEYPYTVPEGHVFVMGDNRNNSLDSRSEEIGPVDMRRILGKVILRLAPLEKIGPVD